VSSNISVHSNLGIQGIAASGGGGQAATSSSFSNMPPFAIVTAYMKL
jgi:hypothetical protein